MDSVRIRAKLKALDAIDSMLDDRDAESAKRLKAVGVIQQKGSDTALDGDGIGRKDPAEQKEDDGTHDSTQDAEDNDFTEHGEGESQDDTQDGGKESAEDGEGEDDGFMAELKKMSASNPSAKNALSMLSDDEDENESQDTAPRKGKRRDSSKV